jgi:Cu+-exporting ATPase
VNVEGMTCNNCALGVTKKLEKLGLESVNTSFSTGEVSFVNPSKVGETKVFEAIKSLGFSPSSGAKSEESGISRIELKFYGSLILTLPLFLAMFFPAGSFLHNPYVQLSLCIPVLCLGIVHFGKSALGSLRNRMANMDVLIFIGFTAAFGYSLAGMFMYADTAIVHQHLFFETTATIITLVLLGNVLEHRSVHQTTTALRSLTALQDVKAKLVDKHDAQEHIKEISAAEIKVNDILFVNTGDQIPADGVLIQGSGLVDESMISGESAPITKAENADLIGGTILSDGQIRMRATRIGKDSVLAGIIRLVKEAQNDKPPIQRLGDKVSAIFVPAVIGIAATTFLLSWFAFDVNLQQSLMRSIAVLVISCPCAMGLATPTAVIAGIGRGAKKGILIKGGSTLETFASIETVVFDKTGTLTTGAFKLNNFEIVAGVNEQELRDVVFSLEQRSSHPIAKSLVKELGGSAKLIDLSEFEEIKGEGITAKGDNGAVWSLGSARFTKQADPDVLHLLKNNEPVAKLDIGDALKAGAKELFGWLGKNGIKTVLLTGDHSAKANAIATELGISEVYAEQLPDQKLAVIEELSKSGKVAMVGDGINDAPALAKADVGISLGDATQVAIQSAQVVLLNGKDLSGIRTAFLISKHTLITIKQNLFWAFAYNVVAIPIAALGFLNPMVAALSMAFSDVIVIGNSIRLKSKRLR